MRASQLFSISTAGHTPQSSESKANTLLLAGNDAVPEYLTGREYLTLLSKLYSTPLAGIDAFADRYRMTQALDVLTEDYSHGMKKKLQLIAAFCLKRPVTLIDETLNGIDFTSLYLAKQDLLDLAKSSVVVLCSHDRTALEGTVCEYHTVDRGRLLPAITAEEMVQKYSSVSDYLVGLIDNEQRPHS